MIPGIELPQFFHSFMEVDFRSVSVPFSHPPGYARVKFMM
jgi:hypothetical protein